MRRRWRLGRPPVGKGRSKMAIALDGKGSNAGSGASGTVSLSTDSAPDLVRVAIEANGPGMAVTGVTSSSGLKWQQRAQVSTPGSSTLLDMEVWYAIATQPLSNETITIDFSTSSVYYSATAWGLSGANTTAPFRNASAVTAPSGAVSVSCQAGDWADGAYRLANVPNPTAPGAPWVPIQAGNWQLIVGQLVSSAQTGLAIQLGNGVSNGGIGDAIVASGSSPPPPPPSEVLTVTAPSNVVTGSAVAITGTVTGATLSSLNYVLDSGSTVALGQFSQTGTAWTGSLPAFTAAGNHTLMVEDPATGVKSASVSFAVSASAPPPPASQTLTFDAANCTITGTGSITPGTYTGSITVTGTVTNIMLNGTAI